MFLYIYHYKVTQLESFINTFVFSQYRGIKMQENNSKTLPAVTSPTHLDLSETTLRLLNVDGQNYASALLNMGATPTHIDQLVKIFTRPTQTGSQKSIAYGLGALYEDHSDLLTYGFSSPDRFQEVKELAEDSASLKNEIMNHEDQLSISYRTSLRLVRELGSEERAYALLEMIIPSANDLYLFEGTDSEPKAKRIRNKGDLGKIVNTLLDEAKEREATPEAVFKSRFRDLKEDFERDESEYD